MNRKSLTLIAAMIMMLSCAHAPTAGQKALEVAQTVDAIALKVAKVSPQILSGIDDTHLYNQAAKAYNDFLGVAQEYDRLVQVAERLGTAPPLEEISKVIQVVFDFIESLKKMGVDVSKLNKIALRLYEEEENGN